MGRASLGKLLPAALVVLAPMVMLYPIWANPTSAGEDDLIYYYPLRKLVGQALRQGRLPLENPYEATGAPLMADPQSAVLYPPTWLFAAMEAKLAYSVSIFLAFSLAGAGAYLYLRRLGLIRPAATFGCVAFMFCGFMVGHRVHLAMIHTACYLPWLLWCIEGLRRNRLRAFLWMAPVVFLTITSGHWPTLVQMSVICTAYLLLRGRPVLPAVATAAAAVAVAAMFASPQIFLTGDLLAETTRQRIGYATAGENSFLPVAGVLAMFPMLMGSRTPNFFPQSWWGPWHLCEMLGYVGLATLALAGAAVWRLYRKSGEADLDGTDKNDLRDVVRKWTWLAVAVGVWMLGYYLPTYRLVYLLPVLGVVRCPARMLLTMDLALATLAAVSIHVIVKAGTSQQRPVRLMKTVRRVATIVLPLTMLGCLAALGVAAWALLDVWPDGIPFFAGGARDALAAVRPGNPAVWIPLALAVATGVVIRFWLARPRRRAAMLVIVLIADLFFITGFVDVPADNRQAQGPAPKDSPAATWLARHGQADGAYRVWGLAGSYCDRPAELLAPKAAHSLGISTIAGYGPFQTPAHARLLGFSIFGTNSDWQRLLRTNHLLSRYNVRYILAADRNYRRRIESIRIPETAAPREGPNLLSGRWATDQAEIIGEGVRLRTPSWWRSSRASQRISIMGGGVCRIRLDARGPDGGAAGFLRAKLVRDLSAGDWWQEDHTSLTIGPEQIGPDWRHFEWTFEVPEIPGGQADFCVFSMSERPIEIRNVSLRRSSWETPIGNDGRLAPGQRVYRKLVELPARRAGDEPVAIYENLLCRTQPERFADGRPDEQTLERLKWYRGELDQRVEPLPALGASVSSPPARPVVLLAALAAAGYATVALMAVVRRGKNRKNISW